MSELNSKPAMIRLLTMTLFLCGIALAQTRPNRPPPAVATLQRVEDAILKMDLNKDQLQQAQVIVQSTLQQVEALQQQSTQGDATARDNIFEVMEDMQISLSQVLSPDQLTDVQRVMRNNAEAPATRPGLSPQQLESLKPLTELGTQQYHGFDGGLYPDGKNDPPADHLAAGTALAKQIQPLDADGKAADDGKIVMLVVGLLDTSIEFNAFKPLLDADPNHNRHLILFNGCQAGMTAMAIQNAHDGGSGEQFWGIVNQRLANTHLSAKQVQVVWLSDWDNTARDDFPVTTRLLQRELANIVRTLQQEYPNLKQVYVSSRAFGGYSTVFNPGEPYAYETGFAVKWLIGKQIQGEPLLNFDPAKGEVKAPWLSWGPYLWANGATRRADGLMYEPSDFLEDGLRPSSTGKEKIGREILQFFQTCPTSKSWLD